jgi:hypothetical protein
MKDLDSALQNLFQLKGISFRSNRKSLILDRCPRCSGEKCYIRRKDGRSICFSGKCGAKWSYKGIISELLSIPQSDVPKLLFGQDSSQDYEEIKIDFGKMELDLEDDWDFDDEDEPEEQISPIHMGPDFIPVERSEVAINYLLQRKIFDPSLITAYDIRYQAVMNAIVFPVTKDGRVYGWQARSIPPLREGQLRLITSPGFNKSKFLLNYDRAKEQKKIVLTEGPVDCIHADVPGYGAVCSFGKSVSRKQIELLLETKAEAVYIGLDRDAYREADYLCRMICPYKAVYRVLPPDHRKDLGECTFQEVQESLSKAQKCDSYPASRLEIYLKT